MARAAAPRQSLARARRQARRPPRSPPHCQIARRVEGLSYSKVLGSVNDSTPINCFKVNVVNVNASNFTFRVLPRRVGRALLPAVHRSLDVRRSSLRNRTAGLLQVAPSERIRPPPRYAA